MSDCGCKIEAENTEQRRILGYLLLINATMFVLEVITGSLAQSTALIADSLDMLADAVVYGISLSAVGGTSHSKARAASVSGIFQITLAVLVLFDVIRKFVFGNSPESTLMMGIGFVALMANIVCLWLIAKHRKGEVHMRASWIFSKNDVIANLGVIAAGVMVSLSQSQIPDLIAGMAITILVLRGGFQILREARDAKAGL